MFCNSLLEIHLQMTITVHKHVSETGKQNMVWRKGSATEGFQKTLNWDFWLGIKRRMETEVGHHLNCHTVTNTIQMLRELRLETPRHKPHTSLYVPQAMRGLESHSQPTAQNLIALHILTVTLSGIQLKFTDHDSSRPVTIASQCSWTSIFKISAIHDHPFQCHCLDLSWLILIKWDETMWLVSQVPHTSATAQNTPGCLAFNKVGCFAALWNDSLFQLTL